MITNKHIILICLIIFFLAGCQSSSDAIKIGVLAPLSGNAAELGEHIQRGVDLANKDLNYQYELIYEDDKCTDTKSALSAAQKFATIDDVSLVIGPLCAPAYQAVSGYFNDQGIGFMHTSGVTPSFIESSGDFGIAGLTTTIYQEDDFLADYIFFDLNISRMGVFVWNQEWGIEHQNGFIDRFTELGGEIVFNEVFEVSDSDFRTPLLKLQESGAEGIFIVGLNFQQSEIVKQLNEFDSDIQIFGQFEIEDPAFIDPAGSHAEGVMYVYPAINTYHPKTQQFILSYEQTYNTTPNYYSFIGYDSLLLYDHAITVCKDVDSSCIIDIIKKSQEFLGVGGEISFQEDGTIHRDFVMKTIEDGIFKEIKKEKKKAPLSSSTSSS